VDRFDHKDPTNMAKCVDDVADDIVRAAQVAREVRGCYCLLLSTFSLVVITCSSSLCVISLLAAMSE
jgi:hypothetical protein